MRSPSSRPFRLLTLTEAADLSRCSVATLRRRIKDGALQAIQHGRIVRIEERELRSFLHQKRRWL